MQAERQRETARMEVGSQRIIGVSGGAFTGGSHRSPEVGEMRRPNTNQRLVRNPDG